jgi:hypothetical protein
MSIIANNLRATYKKYLAGKPAERFSLKQWAKQHDETDKVKAWLKGKKEARKPAEGHAPYLKKRNKAAK